MAETELVTELARLPDPNTNEFLIETRQLAARIPDAAADLPRLIEDRSLPVLTRFNALYLLLFRLRRLKDYREYRAWVDHCRNDFSSFSLFHTFDAVYERSLGDDQRSLERAVRASRRALDDLSSFPGVLHQFAEFVASLGEIHRAASSADLKEAETAVRRAIALSHEAQPHFWATLARLQALQGDFDSARRSIVEAIELEPSSGQDYALRITEYRLIETQISFSQERERIDRRDQEAREELRTIRGQLLEVLGLLAAIIAFISFSVSVAGGKSFEQTSRLMLLMGGIIIGVFASFAYAFRVSSLRRVLVPLIFGSALVTAALLYKGWAK